MAVARALGDLWSYNAEDDVFVVSPDPDCHVYDLNVLKDRCLVLATDGAWNMLSPDMVIQSVSESEMNNERHMINPQGEHKWMNPSKRLVDLALNRWKECQLRADNTSIVTVMLDPPGPPRAQVLKRLYGVNPTTEPREEPPVNSNVQLKSKEEKPNIAIISRFPNSTNNSEQEGKDLITSTEVKSNKSLNSLIVPQDDNSSVRFVHDSSRSEPSKIVVKPADVPDPSLALSRGPSIPFSPIVEEPIDVQINEVSSSKSDDPPPLPHKVTKKTSSTAAVSTPTLRRELADLKLNASSLCLERGRTRHQSGTAQARRSMEMPAQDSHENQPPKLNANAATPKKNHASITKATEISPRILRPRNTPSKLVQTPSQEHLGGLKRKRRSGSDGQGGSNESNAPKVLRSTSKQKPPLGRRIAGPGATPGRPVRK